MFFFSIFFQIFFERLVRLGERHCDAGEDRSGDAGRPSVRDWDRAGRDGSDGVEH